MKLNVFTVTILLICFIDRGQFSRLNKRDLFGTKPPDAPCTFNACNLQNNCSKTEKCISDSDCKPKCICAAGYTGSQCDVKLLNESSVTVQPNQTEASTAVGANTMTTETPLDACSPTYVLRPFSERFCFGLMCKYGICDTILTDNGVKFKCECDTGADGNICEHQCCKDCGENGHCEVNTTGVEYCNCETIKYYGDFCNLTRTNSSSTNYTDTQYTYVRENWYLWVVGSCAIVLAILLGTLIIFPYYLWKKRFTFMMKVVYYFQPYEDNDERKWDAFVSYKSGDEDENFVIRKLRPMLEDEIGFKLCLHFRDFLPGETIANNILRAVNGSRRTILLLTQRYVESEWTQFEYQIAQELTLQRKHRIIPVVLSDISPVMATMDQNLKHIIKSITYLEWPEDGNEKKINDFWNKLKLSLPKRKNLEQKEKQKETKVLDKENASESDIDIDYNRLNNLEPDNIKNPHIGTTNISHNDVVLNMYSNSKENTEIFRICQMR